MVGKRYGKLLVLSFAGKVKSRNMWNCLCDCGQEAIVREGNLLDGHTTSCGCMSKKPYRYRHLVEGTCIESISSQAIYRDNTSGVRGVCLDKRSGNWVARIAFKGKSYYLGSYKDKAEAIKARQEGEEIYKEFLEKYYEDR